MTDLRRTEECRYFIQLDRRTDRRRYSLSRVRLDRSLYLSVSLFFILCRVSTTISPTPGTLTHSLFTMETREASQMESSEKVESFLRPGRSRVDLILI
jgi:hypothetical protein